MAKKKHKKKVETASFVEIEKDFGLWEDYMAFGPQYDTVNDCPLYPQVKRNVYKNFRSRN